MSHKAKHILRDITAALEELHRDPDPSKSTDVKMIDWHSFRENGITAAAMLDKNGNQTVIFRAEQPFTVDRAEALYDAMGEVRGKLAAGHIAGFEKAGNLDGR